MPLTFNTKTRRFLFQNTSGVFYDVLLKYDGTGYAVKATGSSSKGDGNKIGKTKIALAVDAGKLTAFRGAHVSRLWHEAMFNTAKSLATVLNAAS